MFFLHGFKKKWGISTPVKLICITNLNVEYVVKKIFLFFDSTYSYLKIHYWEKLHILHCWTFSQTLEVPPSPPHQDTPVDHDNLWKFIISPHED